MYNPNLKLYTVKQVNGNNEHGETGGPLNEVIDPNMEFQDSTPSLVPASALESYGIGLLTPPTTPGSKRSTEFNAPVSKGFGKKSANEERRLSETLEIPQVHAYIAITKMDRPTNSNASKTYNKSQPMIHGASSRITTKYLANEASVIVKKRSLVHASNSKDVAGEQIVDTHTSTPLNISVNSRKPNAAPSLMIDASSNQATTAEQLAWAFRAARDRLETASNASACSSRFDMECNCSDRADTMSSFSDVSGYEEELFRIRRLLLQDSSSSYLEKHLGHHSYDLERKYSAHSGTPFITSGGSKEDTFDVYKKNLELLNQKLNADLQAALVDKEKCKLEYSEVATKSDFEWQLKFQDVLRQKANTDGRLEIVQTEVETLRKLVLSKDRDDTESELTTIQRELREVRSRNQEQTMQLELAESEINRWKEEAQDMDTVNERLRIQLQELRLDMESKDGGIQGLKMKVASQHVELQSFLQAKLKAENSTASMINEIEAIRKSEYWYREQLHLCQAAKVKVQQELMTSQGNVVAFKHLIEKLKSEAVNLQSVAEETQQRAVREKDTLMRKLEMIHADMLEREATILGKIRIEDTTVDTITAKLHSIEENSVSETNIVAQELKQQIGVLKHEIELRDAKMSQLGSENAQLMMRITTLQKNLNDKEFAVQNLEIKHKNLEISFHTTNENLKTKESILLETKNEKVVVEVALAAAGREKTEVNAAIEKLRDDFASITKNYQAMKEELRTKEKGILSLETQLRETEKINAQQKEKILQYRNIEEELRETHVIISEVNKWEQKLKSSDIKNEELNRKIRETTEAKDYAIMQVSKLKEMLTFREEQLLNQTRSFEVHTEELKSRDQLISSLESENKTFGETLNNSKERIRELEELNLNKSKEVQFANVQLSRYKFVIEQFNFSCRGSEEEKHQLKQLLIDVHCTKLLIPNISKLAVATQTTSHNSINSSSQTDGDQPISLDEPLSVQLLTKEQVQNYMKEIDQLKCSMRMSDVEKRDKQRRYETNIRTLLKKVKEHMRGRKNAEKALTEFCCRSESEPSKLPESSVISFQLEIKRLEAEIECGHRKYNELNKIMEKSEEAVIELEKERGKLVQSQDGNAVNAQNTEKKVTDHADDLGEQIRKQQIIIQELRKQIFVEKRDNSQLRKQVSSLQMGLDMATDVLDNKKIDLGRSESINQVLQDAIAQLQRELEVEQDLHESCKQVVEKLKRDLDEAKAKDPMLADQIKMLSYHLHEKKQEAANLQDHNRLSEERWMSTKNGFKRSVNAFKEEIAELRAELEAVCKDKFALQAQAVELQTGLQSSLDKNKLLRLKVDAYDRTSSSESGLPDLMSSLPSAPMTYNELQIAELLHGSSKTLPSNKPLNNLQSCLDSLKQEMATLQQQLAAKASAQSAAKVGNVINEGSIVKEV